MMASGAASGGTAGPWRGGWGIYMYIQVYENGFKWKDVCVHTHTSIGPLGASITEGMSEQ